MVKTAWSGIALLFMSTGCMAHEDPAGASTAEVVIANPDGPVSLMEAGSGDILWQIDPAEDGGEDDGTSLWEILNFGDGEEGGTILWQVVDPRDGGEDDGTILWEILNADGRFMCRISGPYLSDVRGRLLLEARAGDVYAIGGVSPRYVFVDDEVLAADGSPLLTTNPAQESASDARKLLIAALVEGRCGSPGLP